ncbi:cobalamin-binding protein [Candidatus Sumerlaeota bacterium]|nr:cobalamin-binding protein [Candidatus Sumerlaeota bacterium]
MEELLNRLITAIEFGKRKDATALTQELLDAGMPPKDILEKGMICAMSSVGAKFKADEIFVPEVLIAARAMKASMAVLKPTLVEAGIKPKGTIIIGTIAGDLHDIGKNLVAMMCEGCGLSVIDLGVDVTPERFVDAVQENKPRIVAISALLTTTMVNIPSVLEALGTAGLRDHVKVMVGGAPVTQEWATSIGADGYTEDAASAAEMAQALIG